MLRRTAPPARRKRRVRKKKAGASPRQSQKLRYVVAEVVDTEGAYVESLEALCEEERRMREEGLGEEEARAIFANARQLCVLHREMLREMREEGADVARTLAKYGEPMECYSAFIGHYDAGHACALARCDAETMKRLESLRVRPVQRVPRYVLLTREMVKAGGGPQCAAAHAEMSRVAGYINEQKREAEMRERLLDIQARLQGSDQSSLRETSLTAAVPHKWRARYSRKRRACHLCNLEIHVGQREWRCRCCKQRTHDACVNRFPDDCDGEKTERAPHSLLAPHRKILDEALVAYRGERLDRPKRSTIQAAPLQEGHRVALFCDSILILRELEGGAMRLVELVKWRSRQEGVLPAVLSPIDDTSLSISSHKSGVLHLLRFASAAECLTWMTLMEDSMRSWNEWVQRSEEARASQIKRLEGVHARIDGIVPVANEFTTYMIVLTGLEEEPVTILKRYSELFALHKMLKDQFPGLPHFPGKTLFNMNAAVLNKRQVSIEQWLDALLSTPSALQIDAVRAFFKTDDVGGKEPWAVAEGGLKPSFYPPDVTLGRSRIALYEFDGTGEQQLEHVSAGEHLILIKEHPQEGWAWVRRVADSSLGWYPLDFLNLEEQEELAVVM